ncbi:hypothetical protein KAT92_05065, partial [Candidatus Babeliales bacterium]|nr:hypothetical protein [Candidatus Babeliales bacterium]
MQTRHISYIIVLSIILSCFSSPALAILDSTFTRSRQPRQGLFLYQVLESTTPTPYPKHEEQIETDTHNYYKYSEHFRIIVGKEYGNYEPTTSLMDSCLEHGEFVYEKIVSEMGYRPPRNSAQYYIDMYIGNRRARNYYSNSTVYIDDMYAGYADEYGTSAQAFFVLNPVIPRYLVKVVLAHEFFHTVQFAYKSINDFRNSDFWFLEATAVFMEEMVYPEVNDYLTFIEEWYNSSHRAIDTFNSSHEYGEVIFALYLEYRFGQDFIQTIIEDFETSDHVLDILDDRLVTDEGTSLNEVFEGFMEATMEPESYFDDGEEFLSINYRNINDYTNISYELYGPRYFFVSGSSCTVFSDEDMLDSFLVTGESYIDLLDFYDPYYRYVINVLSEDSRIGTACSRRRAMIYLQE